MKSIKRILMMSLATVLSVSSLAVLPVARVHAATCQWDGSAADDDFNNGVNWTGCTGAGSGGDLAPAAADVIEFPQAITHTNPVDLSADITVSGITFTGAFTTTPYTIGDASETFTITIQGSGAITNSGTGAAADHVFNGDIDFDGTGGTSPSIVNTANSSATLNFAGDVNIETGVSLTVSSGFGSVDQVVEFDGLVTGPGNITISTGSVDFNAANTYAGITTISNGGLLLLNAGSALGSSAGKTVISSGGTLELASGGPSTLPDNFEINGRGNTGSETVTDAAAAFITNKNISLSNVTLTGTTAVCAAGSAVTLTLFSGAGTGDVVTTTHSLYKSASASCDGTSKNNTNNLTVDPGASEDSTYNLTNSGAQTVTSGQNAIIVNDGTADVTVAAGGRLSGEGTVGSITAQDGSFVAPGSSPGCITTTGNLTLSSGSTYEFEVQNDTACTGYDQFVVGGDVDVTGATLDVTLIPTITYSVGDTFTIILNNGTNQVVGTFTGLAEGATVTDDLGGTFTISYVGGGGDNNDVVLTAVTLPSAGGTGGGAGADEEEATTDADAPDTGFGAMLTNPLGIMFSTTSIAGAIMGLDKKYKLLKNLK